MGMFSTVISSCETLMLGQLQSKDLESLMDTYWLSPDGYLYRIDDTETWNLTWEPSDSNLPGLRTVPTGKRGRLRPYRIYGSVRFTDGRQEAVAWFEDGAMKQVLCKGAIFSCERVDRSNDRS